MGFLTTSQQQGGLHGETWAPQGEAPGTQVCRLLPSPPQSWGQMAAALLVSHSGLTRPKEEIGERKHLFPTDSRGGGNFTEAPSRAG